MNYEPFSLKQRIARIRKPSTVNFYDYLQQMKEIMRSDLERREGEYNELSAKALLGDPEAVAYFQNEIEKHLRKHPFHGNIPPAYNNMVDALFHEWKGFSQIYEWFIHPKYGDSSDLQIIGTQAFYMEKGRFKPYPYKLPSLDRVEQLKRSLKRNDDTVKLDRENPSGELKMNDPLWPGRFIRIAIWVEPRVWDGFTTITLRRQMVEFLNLEEQAGTESIPYDAVEMIRFLTLCYRNTIIAGPVNSGKTTFANTIVGEQMLNAHNPLGVVMIEKHPESILPFSFKENHRIVPVKAQDEELMDVGIESLRHNPNIIYMTEMRYNEWEFYLWSGSKGYDGLTGTFHTVDSEDIPYQGAFSVFTRLGGELKGHLISALQACELVFVMESVDQGEETKKRLTRISEICFDEEERKVYANDIMRFNRKESQWEYQSELSPSFLEKCERKNPVATRKFLESLQRLSEQYPMQGSPIKESIRSQILLQG